MPTLPPAYAVRVKPAVPDSGFYERQAHLLNGIPAPRRRTTAGHQGSGWTLRQRCLTDEVNWLLGPNTGIPQSVLQRGILACAYDQTGVGAAFFIGGGKNDLYRGS